jgi:hypothetical protein
MPFLGLLQFEKKNVMIISSAPSSASGLTKEKVGRVKTLWVTPWESSQPSSLFEFIIGSHETPSSTLLIWNSFIAQIDC